MSMNVFLSVGRASTTVQEQFIISLEKYLSNNGLTPLTVGRNYFKNQQPLKSVVECMTECSGTVILAYERTHIEGAIEKRGSAHETAVSNIKLPTVWNQIEAALAYALGHPLLVLVENGLKSEGLLEHGYDWYVKWVNLREADFSDSEFIGVFFDWKKKVEDYQHSASGKGLSFVSGDTEEDFEEIDEQIAHYRLLIKEYQKRLRVLEVQSAQFGIQVPAHVQVEVNAIGDKIRAAKDSIALLKSQR